MQGFQIFHCIFLNRVEQILFLHIAGVFRSTHYKMTLKKVEASTRSSTDLLGFGLTLKKGNTVLH